MNKVVFFSIFGIVVSESGGKCAVWWWDRTKSDLIAIFAHIHLIFWYHKKLILEEKIWMACGTNKLKIKNKQTKLKTSCKEILLKIFPQMIVAVRRNFETHPFMKNSNTIFQVETKKWSLDQLYLCHFYSYKYLFLSPRWHC